MAKQKQDDQPELTYSSYVRTQDVTQKTCRRRWTIGKSGERWSRISVLAARHDDDDDDGLPKEAVAAIMMLNKNTKLKVHSPDGDTDFLDIVASVMQGDPLASYRFKNYDTIRTLIDCMKENVIRLEMPRSRRHTTQTITNVDYANDLVPLENTSIQTISLLQEKP